MLKISRESEINLFNVLIDHDIISGKDLPNIKKLSTEGKKSQIDAVFELKLTNEDKILDVLVKEQNLEVIDLSKVDFIFMRQNPPFNMDYITATFLLEKISNKTRIINDPFAVRNMPEKLYMYLSKNKILK